ncbi:hypothetical protein [Pseudarthrobacter sp. LMD1-1-1.1]|uniref:hypothetical protein n=1 Tax=Pseudarthrobacter sp. LMD1-1-1.1 TaxID=3135242 RepID=UPI00343CB657
MEDASYIKPRVVQPVLTTDYFPSPDSIADMCMLPCLKCGAMVQMTLRSQHVGWHEQQARAIAGWTEAKKEPRGRHHLTEDHNADPICNCGWDPSTYGIRVGSREDARQLVRMHIAEAKNGG